MTDRPYDIVHDHSGFVAFAFANQLATPLVQTLHAPFSDDTFAFYKRHGRKGQAIAISRYQAREAPPQLRIVDVVYNPLVVDDSAILLQHHQLHQPSALVQFRSCSARTQPAPPADTRCARPGD